MAAIVAALCAPAAMADKLPKTAQPMDSSAVSAIYSGKSADWGASKAYFAPDGSVIGYNAKSKGTYTGKWHVSGNRNCMDIHWTAYKTGKSGDATDCWDWFVDGKKTWAQWSVRYDGSKPGKSDYSRDEVKKLKAGDHVSEQYAKLTGK